MTGVASADNELEPVFYNNTTLNKMYICKSGFEEEQQISTALS
jgi:hypothetical protein